MTGINKLWTEKYRPDTLDGYVFKDARTKDQINSIIKEKSFGNMLITGPAGTGKTTLAKILINQCNVNEYDIMEINASLENSVDDVRNRIQDFVMTIPFGKFKVVFLDEADYASLAFQASLRHLIETSSDNCRFILTANLPNKLMPAIHSRCMNIHIDKSDINEFTARAATVLITEGIEFDIDDLDLYVKSNYPDLRKCLNSLQHNSIGGELKSPTQESGSNDYKAMMVDLFKNGQYKKARELICSQFRPEEMDELFRFFYDNLDLWSSTDEGKDKAIMIIRKGLVNAAVVADPEINLSATIIELTQIGE